MFKKIAIASLSLLLVLGFFLFSYRTAQAEKNLESKIKKSIVKFNNKTEDKILKIDEREYKKSKLYDLSDDEFYYTVDSSGYIVSITRNYSNFKKQDGKISEESAKLKAYEIINKLDRKLEKYSIEVNYKIVGGHDLYIINLKEKSSNNKNTGNFISIQLFSDGQLESLVSSIENVDATSNNETLISKDTAKDIILSYFKNHKVLKSCVKDLNESNLIIQSDIFHGINVWTITAIFSQTDLGPISVEYFLDATTGEFVYKGEPALPGFEADVRLIKKWDELINNGTSAK